MCRSAARAGHFGGGRFHGSMTGGVGSRVVSAAEHFGARKGCRAPGVPAGADGCPEKKRAHFRARQLDSPRVAQRSAKWPRVPSAPPREKCRRRGAAETQQEASSAAGFVARAAWDRNTPEARLAFFRCRSPCERDSELPECALESAHTRKQHLHACAGSAIVCIDTVMVGLHAGEQSRSLRPSSYITPVAVWLSRNAARPTIAISSSA